MSSPADRELVRAGFRAGWAAACLAIAEDLDRRAAPHAATSIRRAAHVPPPIEVGDVSELKKVDGEVVLLDLVGPKGGARG